MTKPSPTEASKITPMITASLRSPMKNDAQAVTASKDQQAPDSPWPYGE